MKPNIKKNDILKIIAMLTMLIDHMGVLYFPEYQIFRSIGRIAFPIFAFYLAVGFAYTSDKKMYALRLLTVGVFAQIPYMFLNVQVEAHFLGFNVLLLFAYAIGMLYIFDLCVKSIKEKEFSLSILYLIAFLFILILPDFLEYLIPGFYISYGSYGLVLILLFYTLFNKLHILLPAFIIISFLFAYLNGVQNISNYSNISYFNVLFNYQMVWNEITLYKDGLKQLQGYFFQSRSILGVLLIIYLRKLKFEFVLPKYVTYLFYPLHIAILVIVRFLIA